MRERALKLSSPRRGDQVGPPEIRHWFIHKAQEIQYRKTRAAYWLYIRGSRSRAAHFLAQLKGLLAAYPDSWPALCGLESRALIAAFDGDVKAEIKYMKRLVKSQLWLLASAMPGQIIDYPRQYVVLCYEVLAVLCSECAQLSRSEQWISACKRLAKQKRLRFSERRLRCGLQPENRSEYKIGLRRQLYIDWLGYWKTINWKWKPAHPSGELGE